MCNPDGLRWTAAGRLFQARIWREYAMATRHDIQTTSGVGRRWVLDVLRCKEHECLRRSRLNVYLARRINRTTERRIP